MARISSFRETGERYPVLRLLATICNGFGILLLAFAGLLFAAGLVSFLTFPPKVPNDSLGWIGILQKIRCNSRSPLTLGS